MTRNSDSITIRDVARQAGVSVATVSRYLNNSAPVSEKVSERIEKVMSDLKYVPHAAARHLATNKTQIIGLLLTNMHNDFFAPLLAGIEVASRENGYNLLVGTCQGGSGITTPIGPHNADGILVFADSLSDDNLLNLHDRGFPIVLIHRTAPKNVDIPSVTVENKNATRQLINHLIVSHGKQRILFLHGPRNQEDSYWRYLGYQTALETHGISLDPSLEVEGRFERDVAFKNLCEHIDNNSDLKFDAVFAGDDDAAVGVINALKEKGYRIPEQIAVVGFDDSRMSPFLMPPLTTVRAPTEEVGRVATQQLLNLLSGEKTQENTILLPTEIIIRNSCGCI
ncbi:LacI family DNA-binding transcriptional regulator [Chloroflexota bacterium]